MLKLFRIHNDSYLIVTRGHKLETTNRTDTVMALLALNITHVDVENAIVGMQLGGHSVAHFGINRTFLFSEKLYS